MIVEDLPADAQHLAKCALAAEVLRNSGRLRLRVNGWSMLPSVWPGDTLWIERASRKTIAEGDIVLFTRDQRLFAHRVVGRSTGDLGILTRGDAMRVADPPVNDDELLGRVVAMQRNANFIVPRKTLSAWEHIVATLVSRSVSLARIVVGVYGLMQSQSTQTA